MKECKCGLRTRLVGDGCSVCNPAYYLPIIEEQYEEAEEKLERIESFCNAYPVDVFPEPDLKKAHEILRRGGMTLDAISASVARTILKGVIEIIEADSQKGGRGNE